MSSNGAEPNLKVDGRVRELDKNLRIIMNESPDLSKGSPSNGQYPTAVSSRNQTIPSREIARP